jgi:hypothetical protein
MTTEQLIAAIQANVDNYRYMIADPRTSADTVERLSRVIVGYERDIAELAEKSL